MSCNYLKLFKDFYSKCENERITNKGTSAVSNIFLIELNDVGFRYSGTEKNAIQSLNYRFEQGKHYAIIGENGAVKSTLIKLILKLYEVNSGDIYVNGVNIRNLDYDNYLYRISALFQDFKLFSISIKDNICMQDSVDESRLENAIKWVGLDEIIKEFPKGVDALYYLRI